MKKLKHLDYAVYDNLIVPLLLFGPEVWFQVDEDSDHGKCRVVCKQRKKKNTLHIEKNTPPAN